MKLAKKLAGQLAASVDGRDVFLFGGLLFVCIGLVAVYWPAAFIVPGAVLAALGIYAVVKS